MTSLSGSIGGWARGRVMNWLVRDLAQRASPENPSTNLANPAQWLVDFVTGGKSAAGMAVNEEKASGVAVAYSCVYLIAKTIATLPLHVFEDEERGPKVLAKHPMARVLRKTPNDYQTSYVWRQLMMTHVLFWGNHYSQILYDGALRVRGLLPLHPWNVTPKLTPDGRGKVYEVRLERGGKVELPEDEVLHIPGLSFDGLTGISPVRKLKNTFGLALATEQFASAFFANGAKPGVILETPGKMNDTAQKNLVNSLVEKFGADVAGWFRPLVLEEGVKMHTVQMPLKDAEFLATAKLPDTRICGAYGVPPHMVGLVDKSTSWGSGIEQQDIGFGKHTISPWCTCVEQEFARKLFAGGDSVYAKFSLQGLMRGDFRTRMAGYATAVGGPFMAPDEARALEELPTLGGEYAKPFRPLNMDGKAKPTDPAAEDDPPPPPQPDNEDEE